MIFVRLRSFFSPDLVRTVVVALHLEAARRRRTAVFTILDLAQLTLDSRFRACGACNSHSRAV